MNCCAVIIFLWLLSAEAACRPLPTGTSATAVIKTVRQIQEKTKATLLLLVQSGQLPNISCLSLNATGLAVPEQQLFTAHNLSSWRCYMVVMSTLTPTLEPHLMPIIENIFSLELKWGPPADCPKAPKPPVEPAYYNVHVKCMLECMLELLDQQLSNAKFDFTA